MLAVVASGPPAENTVIICDHDLSCPFSEMTHALNEVIKRWYQADSSGRFSVSAGMHRVSVEGSGYQWKAPGISAAVVAASRLSLHRSGMRPHAAPCNLSGMAARPVDPGGRH